MLFVREWCLLESVSRIKGSLEQQILELLLDEISEMPLKTLQAKLLRVLQEKS